MHSPRQSVVRTGIAAGILAVAVVLGGCTPGPAPTPTPTPLFTSEAEAFKAAEAVYREYVDVLNASTSGDAKADPLRFLVGSALEDSIGEVRDREAKGITIDGSLKITAFGGVSADLSKGSSTVEASACIDLTAARVIDKSGADVTPPDRSKEAKFTLEFVEIRGALKISSSDVVGTSC